MSIVAKVYNPTTRQHLHSTAVQLRCLVRRKDQAAIYYGICDGLRVAAAQMNMSAAACSDSVRMLRRQIMDDWPMNSGDLVYPVPHPTMTGMDAFDHFCERGFNMYGRSVYGRARLALLDYVIEQTAS